MFWIGLLLKQLLNHFFSFLAGCSKYKRFLRSKPFSDIHDIQYMQVLRHQVIWSKMISVFHLELSLIWNYRKRTLSGGWFIKGVLLWCYSQTISLENNWQEMFCVFTLVCLSTPRKKARVLFLYIWQKIKETMILFHTFQLNSYKAMMVIHWTK